MIWLNDKQEKLLDKLLVDMSKCFENYFTNGGLGVKRANFNVVLKEAVKRGAIAYSGDDLDLAGRLTNCDVGYLICFIGIRKNKVKEYGEIIKRLNKMNDANFIQITSNLPSMGEEKINMAKRGL